MKNMQSKNTIYHSTFEALQFGVLLGNKNNEIIDVNQAACKLFEMNKEELIDLKIDTFISEIFKPGDGPIKNIFENETEPKVYKMINRNGLEKYIALRKTLLSGDDNNYLITCLDVTTQINTLEAFNKNKKDYTLLTNTIKDMIIVFNIEKNITFVNNKVSEMFGLPQKQLIGKKLSDLLSPKYHELLEHCKENLVNNTFENKYLEIEFIDKNKEPVNIEAICSPIYNKGESNSVLIVARDISYRKNLEKQLFQTQRMKAVEKMAGGVAHDFNNLLTIIIGNNKLLLNKLDKDSDVAKNLMQIEKACRRAESLTKQLLSFSGQQSLRPKKTQLNDLIVSLVDILKQSLRKDVKLITELKADIKNIFVDSKQLEISIYNLILNGIDNMPSGGNIIIKTRNYFLEEKLQTKHLFTIEAGDYILLEIKDSGKEIAADKLINIFEPFQNTDGLYESSGLDLPSIYGFIKQSGGYIDINSGHEDGTTFKIYFPVNADEEEEKHPALAKSIPLNKPNPTILVAEDEYDLNEMICEILEHHGYDVMFALDGKEALEIVRKNPEKIDLVLSDVIMPEMGGPEFVKEAKKIKKSLKMVYMSGYTDKAISLIENDDRKFEFLQKPFTPDKLLKKIKSLLDNEKIK